MAFDARHRLVQQLLIIFNHQKDRLKILLSLKLQMIGQLHKDKKKDRNNSIIQHIKHQKILLVNRKKQHLRLVVKEQVKQWILKTFMLVQTSHHRINYLRTLQLVNWLSHLFLSTMFLYHHQLVRMVR